MLCFLMGCAPIVFPAFYTPYPKDKDIKSITSVVAIVLQERNFALSVINADIGVITTDWQTMTNSANEKLSAIL
jgi:uncharacterized lipoprotein